MSAGTKHDRDEGEDQVPRLTKKAKTDPAGAPTEGVKPKKEKKDKKSKEKKEKKDKDPKDKEEKKRKKKEKKEKKEKKQAKESVSTGDDVSADNPVESESSEPKKKDKKAKKEKKVNGSDNAVSEKPAVSEAPTDGDQVNGTEQTPGSYKQLPALDAVPETEIQTFLAEEQIVISGGSSSTSPSAATLRPILRFDFLPRSKLVAKDPFASFTKPTPIQASSWPFALSGRDVIGIAETGSGKTLAFSLPCLEALASQAEPRPAKSSKVVHARAVIVSPTRELAMQTHVAISSLASLVGLSAVCLYGGSSKDDQRTLLRRNSGADIIVATPGRLKDFMSEGCVSLSKAKFVVLDEADRMLDKGFEDDIKMILGDCPPREQRQTLMFTATWPTSVRVLAEGYMVNPIKIKIGGQARAGGVDGEDGEAGGVIELQANSRITQKVEVVDPRGKEQRVFQLIREAQQGKAKDDRILVFCLYKKEAVRVEQSLQRKGVRVASIHGDLRQEQRTRSLEAFKAGTTPVLVATDVAARGLDIPEVKLVINVTVRRHGCKVHGGYRSPLPFDPSTPVLT